MNRRMDSVTFTYVLRVASASLAVVLALFLLHDAIRYEEAVSRGRIAGLLIGVLLSAGFAAFLMLNPPD